MSTEQRFRWLWIFVLLAVPVLAFIWAFPEGLGLPLVDAHVYAAAIDKWMAGSDVYSFTTTVNVLYPPVFLYTGGFLASALTPHAGWMIFLALHIIAAISLPFLLYRFYLRGHDVGLAWFFWFYFAAPGFLGILALKFGNIATLGYTLMLSAAIPGLKRNNWVAFYLGVFLCCSIKITFLPMLLLPLLCGRKQWLGAIGCGLASIAGLYSQKLLVPELYSRFQENLRMQAENMGDVGKGVFAMLFHITHKLNYKSLTVPLLGHAAVALVVLLLLVHLRRIGHDQSLPEWPALVVTGILFTMPRVNYYDLCVVVPLIFVLAIRILRIPAPRLIYLGLFVISIPCMIYARDTILNGVVGSLTALALFFMVAIRLARGSGQESLEILQ